MGNYKKMGDGIEVPIKDEYFIVAFINLIDKEKSIYQCDLHIRDKESDMMIRLEKTPIIISDKKNIRGDVAHKLSELIQAKYFDKSVEDIKFLYECTEKLLNISKGETA